MQTIHIRLRPIQHADGTVTPATPATLPPEIEESYLRRMTGSEHQARHASKIRRRYLMAQAIYFQADVPWQIGAAILAACNARPAASWWVNGVRDGRMRDAWVEEMEWLIHEHWGAEFTELSGDISGEAPMWAKWLRAA